MGTEVINSSFVVLQEELEKAKSTLRGLNDNIRRISGREPPEQLRLVMIKLIFCFINIILNIYQCNLIASIENVIIIQ